MVEYFLSCKARGISRLRNVATNLGGNGTGFPSCFFSGTAGHAANFSIRGVSLPTRIRARIVQGIGNSRFPWALAAFFSLQNMPDDCFSTTRGDATHLGFAHAEGKSWLLEALGRTTEPFASHAVDVEEQTNLLAAAIAPCSIQNEIFSLFALPRVSGSRSGDG